MKSVKWRTIGRKEVGEEECMEGGIQNEGHIEGDRRERGQDLVWPGPSAGQIDASHHQPPVRQTIHFTEEDELRMFKMPVNDHAIHSPREVGKWKVGTAPGLEVANERGLGGDAPAQSKAPPSHF